MSAYRPTPVIPMLSLTLFQMVLKPNILNIILTRLGENTNSKCSRLDIEPGMSLFLVPKNSSIFKKRHTEGTWDGLQFEVAGRETATPNNIKRGLEHCADKKTTQVAVFDFPNGGFSHDKFNTALRRYMGLEQLNDGQFLRFKKIICVQMGQIVHQIDM